MTKMTRTGRSELLYRKDQSSHIYSSRELEDKDSHQLPIPMPSTEVRTRESAKFFHMSRWSHIPSVTTRELASAVRDFTPGLKVTHKPLLLGCHLGPRHWAPGRAVYCCCFLTLQSEEAPVESHRW